MAVAPKNGMRTRIAGFCLLAFLSGGCFAQTVKEDMKTAGSDVKNAAKTTGSDVKGAAKETGKATKHTASKVQHTTTHTVHKASQKVADKTTGK